jgi:ribosomal protein S18 acetylase RimI-like enzyme
MTVPVALRPVLSTDAPFLRDLYIDGHSEDFAALPADVAQTIVDLQLRARSAQYAATWRTATDAVILVDDQRVGRLWTARTQNTVRVLDLAVCTRQRRRGIASGLLRDLQQEARHVVLSVWAGNTAARAFYDELEFAQVGSSNGYLELAWSSRISVGATSARSEEGR